MNDEMDQNDGRLSIDELFVRIGIGKYHYLFYLLFTFSLVPQAIQIFILHFAAFPPEWKCISNSSICNVSDIIFPRDKRYPKRCEIPKSEWIYMKPADFSIITQFNLDCGREAYLHLLTSIFFISGLIGGPIFGWAADRYGRFKIFYGTMIVGLSITFANAFVTDYWAFAAVRFISGFCSGGCTGSLYVIASENTTPKHRPLCTIMMYIFSFPVGISLLAFQAYSVQNWKHLFITSSAPYAVLFVLAWFVPESFRWLRLNNKMQKLHRNVELMARMNNVRLPEKFFLEAIPEKLKPNTQPSPLYLVNTSRMFFRTISLGFACFMVSSTYLGLTFATDDLHGDVYWNFVYSGLVEIPAGLLAIVVTVKVGRKLTTTLAYFASGMCCALIPLAKFMISGAAQGWLRTSFGLAAKLFITLGYDVIFVWGVELYPTIIRSEAIAVLSIALGFGSSASPWISDWLLRFHPVLPYVGMGAGAVFSGVLLSFLPETEHSPTPEYMDDIMLSDKRMEHDEPSQKAILLGSITESEANV